MKLNTLAKLSLIGLFYIYIIKLIDTLHHGVFGPVAFIGIIVGFNILAEIAQFLFFIALYKCFLALDGEKLQYAGMLAIIGSGIGLLPKFFALAVLIQHQSLFFWVRHGSLIGAFCPWLSALFLPSILLDCFIEFRDQAKYRLQKGLHCGSNRLVDNVFSPFAGAYKFSYCGQIGFDGRSHGFRPFYIHYDINSHFSMLACFLQSFYHSRSFQPTQSRILKRRLVFIAFVPEDFKNQPCRSRIPKSEYAWTYVV